MSSISRSVRLASPWGPEKARIRVLERPSLTVTRINPSETVFRNPALPMAVPVPPDRPVGCYRYYFRASVNWHNTGTNKDSLPPFVDTAAGMFINMCDTTPLANPLTFAFRYLQPSDSVVVTLSGLANAAVRWDLISALAVSYLIEGSTTPVDTEFSKAQLQAGANTFSFTARDQRFAGLEKSVIWQAVFKGIYANRSDTATDSMKTGVPRPQNPVVLKVSSVGATRIGLSWKPVPGGADSIRIWSGQVRVPLQYDITSGLLTSTLLPGTDTVVAIIDQLLNAPRQMVAQRFDSAHKQLDDLRSLSGRNSDVITNLMRKTRERQATYNKNMESFQASRRILTQHSKSMLDTLSMQAVDDLVAKTRKDMEGSWTTAGMKKGMKTFFDGARDAMQHVAAQAEQTHNAIQAIYRKFNEELGLPVGDSKAFSLQKFRMELERLYEEAETFRNSPMTTMTEQHFVVKKFFISLVSHVRHLFAKANKEADTWFKGILIPLVKQVSENKQLLDQHLETLCKINESRDSLDTKIRELEKRCALLEREEEVLRNIHERLHIPIPAEASSSPDGSAALSRAAS